MGDFFKPWRRKMGVVTLFVAFAFMAIWMRRTDEIQFPIGPVTFYDIRPGPNALYWERVYFVRPMTLNAVEQTYAAGLFKEFAYVFVDCHLVHDVGPRENEEDGQRFKWRWCCCGFEAGEFVKKDDDQTISGTFWFIPYWMIILPLTLLSAYLLLSKPRVAKPKTTIENEIPE